jgi:DNA polymerase-3 subunit delta'
MMMNNINSNESRSNDWHIFGHDWAVNLLQAHAASEKRRHAYLFIGPDGVGRRTLAMRFAQALNCRQAPVPGGFCGVCRDCRGFETLQHPDLSILLPEEGHREILIDQVRALQHTLALSPYSANYRIAFLPDFQRASEEASNALLKTLEEPSEKVILLLTANNQETLLPTIVSRCEVIRLRPTPIQAAQAYLKSAKGLPDEAAQLIAHLSSGRIGAAIDFAEHPELLEGRREILEELIQLLSANRVERFKLAEALTKKYELAREKAALMLPFWLSFWRDVFISCSGADLPLVNVDLALPINEVASQISIKHARALVVSHEQGIQALDAYANVRLLLESLMLKWPYITVSAV